MTGLAERAQEETEPVGRRAQAASSATARSCSIRSGPVNAIGLIVSVPDPGVAERGQAIAHVVLRSAQRDQIDQLVGERRRRLVLLAVEVQVLDLEAASSNP